MQLQMFPGIIGSRFQSFRKDSNILTLGRIKDIESAVNAGDANEGYTFIISINIVINNDNL